WDTYVRAKSMSMILPARKYPSLEARTTFLRHVDERLNTIGAVEAGSTSSNVPLFGGYPRQVVIDGRGLTPGETPRTATMVSIGPRYFDTLGIRLARGRAFNAQDGSPGHEA